MILQLEHIYKNYQQDKLVVPVLKDISLQVEEGEYVAVMGPSGSGKTTLMNIIGCLDMPTEGRYFLENEDVLKKKDRELSDLRLEKIGFVFQSFHLLPRQTALDNVMLPLSYAGIAKKDRIRMAEAALERVGLADRVNFKPTQLSGGQKQRVAIARALVNNPKLLLADEPTGALDSKSGGQIMELFGKLNEEGVTVVMITHDANIAANAKRVIRIIDGMISTDDGGTGEYQAAVPLDSTDDGGTGEHQAAVPLDSTDDGGTGERQAAEPLDSTDDGGTGEHQAAVPLDSMNDGGTGEHQAAVPLDSTDDGETEGADV